MLRHREKPWCLFSNSRKVTYRHYSDIACGITSACTGVPATARIQENNTTPGQPGAMYLRPPPTCLSLHYLNGSPNSRAMNRDSAPQSFDCSHCEKAFSRSFRYGADMESITSNIGSARVILGDRPYVCFSCFPCFLIKIEYFGGFWPRKARFSGTGKLKSSSYVAYRTSAIFLTKSSRRIS